MELANIIVSEKSQAHRKRKAVDVDAISRRPHGEHDLGASRGGLPVLLIEGVFVKIHPVGMSIVVEFCSSKTSLKKVTAIIWKTTPVPVPGAQLMRSTVFS